MHFYYNTLFPRCCYWCVCQNRWLSGQPKKKIKIFLFILFLYSLFFSVSRNSFTLFNIGGWHVCCIYINEQTRKKNSENDFFEPYARCTSYKYCYFNLHKNAFLQIYFSFLNKFYSWLRLRYFHVNLYIFLFCTKNIIKKKKQKGKQCNNLICKSQPPEGCVYIM